MGSEFYTSAEELRTLLEEIYAVPRGKRGQRLGEFLANRFGAGIDTAGQITALLVFLRLVQRVEDEAKLADLDERYKAQIVRDASFFKQKLWSLGSNADLNSVVSNISEERVAALSYVEMVLSKSAAYPEVDEAAKKTIQKLIELNAELVETSLPDALKTSLLEKLDEAILALRNYRIWGPSSVEKSMMTLSGEVAINSATDGDLKKDGFGRKLINTVGEVFQFVGKARKATEDGSKLIEVGKAIADKMPEL